MEKTTLVTRGWIVSFLILLMSFSSQAMAAKGSPGQPEGSDHGRKKDSDDQGTLMGLIFGDQWVIVRDVSADGNGQPVYFTWTWPPEAYNAEGDFDPDPDAEYDIEVDITEQPGCVQPVSFEYAEGLIDPNEVETLVEFEYFDSYGRFKDVYLIPLDPECKIPAAFEETWGELVMEADLGRFNLARSPQDGIDAGYEEALMAINQALSIGLDPAGRLLLELPVVDEFGGPNGSLIKTVDSPRENLALYQMVMREGCLADTANVTLSEETKDILEDGGLLHLVCDNTPPDSNDFLRAASFLGGAGDKTGRVTLDVLVYLNDRLELNEIIWADNKKEIIDIHYYDFQDFSYDRCVEHAATTADLLQPPDDFVGAYPTAFNVVEGVTIFDKRFNYNWPEGECQVGESYYYPLAYVDIDSPIINFVRAADDALTIIDYIHSYELPAYPLDPVPEVE